MNNRGLGYLTGFCLGFLANPSPTRMPTHTHNLNLTDQSPGFPLELMRRLLPAAVICPVPSSCPLYSWGIGPSLLFHV